MPTGWRPTDVAEKYPKKVIEDVYNFEKYNKNASTQLIAWSYFQMIGTASLLMFLFYNFIEIYSNFNFMAFYAAFIFISIYGYTTIMDEKKHGLWIELFRSLVGIVFFIQFGGWFGIQNLFHGAQFIVLAYFAITFIGSILIVNNLKNKENYNLKMA